MTITTSPNFAAKWLVHRLGRFSEAHPEIDLRVSASVQHIDFAREDIDLAIRHGDGEWPGMHVTRLCTEQLFPVCSPKLLSAGALRSPGDIRRHTLLHTNGTTEHHFVGLAATLNGGITHTGIDNKPDRQEFNRRRQAADQV